MLFEGLLMVFDNGLYVSGYLHNNRTMYISLASKVIHTVIIRNIDVLIKLVYIHLVWKSE